MADQVQDQDQDQDQADQRYQMEQPDQPRLDYLPFVTPGEGHVVARTGAEFVARTFGQSATQAEVHFYDTNSYMYQSRLIYTPTNPLRFMPNFNPPLRLGRNAIHYRFRINTWWTVWYNTGWFYVVQPPVITYPSATYNEVPSPDPLIKGRGEPGAKVKLIRASDNVALSAEGSVLASGEWELRFTRPLEGTEHTISVWETVTGRGGWARAENRHFRVHTTVITSPIANAVVPSHEVVFKGDGMPGSSLHIVRADDHSVGLTTPVELTTNTWEAPLKTSLVLSSGPLTVAAQYIYPEIPSGYSPPLTFRVLGIPAITSPSANTVQDQQFTLSGNNGLANAQVEVFRDQMVVAVGRGTVQSNGTWSASVTLPVGFVLLVTKQTMSGIETSRSSPHAFKIRPPRLTEIGVTFPTDNIVRFAGGGYPGALIEVWYKADIGHGHAQWTGRVSKNGEWRIEVTSWASGGYVMSVLQKVSDGSGGWIPSEWSDDVLVEVPIRTDGAQSAATDDPKERDPIQNVPLVIYPAYGQEIKGPPVYVGGTGVYGINAMVEVIEIVNGNRVQVGLGMTNAALWSARCNFSQSSGEKTFIVKYTNSELESGRHTFTYEYDPISGDPPTIDTHESGDYVDMDVLIGGDGRYLATVRAYRDGTEESLGSSVVGYVGSEPGPAPDRWRMQLSNLPAGNFTLTATQTNVVGGTSPRCEPVMLKVRPPALTSIIMAFPTDSTVTFLGSGYPGAKVEITIVSGPSGATPPPVVDVVNGGWETTATDWFFGDYILSVVQSVVDLAGGRIASHEYRFPVTVSLLPPTEVVHTADYTPTFSGKGSTGSTVLVTDREDQTPIAPPVAVRNGVWSSRASSEWGPTWQRLVRVVQQRGDLTSDPVDMTVTIAPLAPAITRLEDNELSPNIFGTCWPGAVVNLKYSDSDIVHHPSGANGSWDFRRETDFSQGVTHTVTVTQTTAQQTSLSASEIFTVQKQLLKPVITRPSPNEEVGRDLIVQGEDGIAGATMQLRDAQFGRPLGEPVLLSCYGAWSVELKGLEFRQYTIDAVQALGGRESERSDYCVFNVVLLPPEVEVPQPGDDRPRTSIISGSAMQGGEVTVRLQGSVEPLLRNLPVDDNDHWEGEVTLPIGTKTIRATQTFNQQVSRESPPLTYNVVPAAPFIETPAEDESAGQQVVVSGFGYAGDTVTVRLEDAPDLVLGQATVLEDRSWSVSVMIDRPGGSHGLIAVQSRDGFDSARSPERSIRVGAYLPQIDVPAEGARVTDPVLFEGQGQPGVGEVTAWFNPDQVLADAVGIANGVWRATSRYALRPGGQWVRFHQNLLAGGKSVWAETKRFEVDPPEPSRK